MSYKSFFVFDNFPQHLVDDAKSIWNNLPKEKENNPSIIKHRQCTPYFEHYVLGWKGELFDYYRNNFKSIIGNRGPLMEFYVCAPTNYVSSPHVDRGRTVGLNIPVEVDINLSTAFFGKYKDLNEYKSSHREYTWNFEAPKLNKPFKGMYEEHKFYHHPIDIPVIFNPAVPHGGWNKAETLRVLLSLSWDYISYEEAVSKFKEVGWIDEVSDS